MDNTTWLIDIYMIVFLGIKILKIIMILMLIKYYYIKDVVINILLDIMM